MARSALWSNSMGSINKDTDRYSNSVGFDVESRKYKFRARCTSYKCSKQNEYGSVIIENVSRNAIDCPECGSVLLWEKYGP